MTLDVADRAAARRRRVRVLATAGLVAAVLAATGAVFLYDGRAVEPPAMPGPPAAPPSSDRATPSPSAPAEPVPDPEAAWVPPERQVVLPGGSDQIDELPIGFPPTPQGAAAAEVAKDRYSTTLDYQLANTVARLYLAPHLAATADQASTAAVRALRQIVGAPETGPAPADVSVTTRPLGVQWVALAPDRTEVSVLAQVDYRTPDRSWSELAASTTVWQWLPGENGRPADWRLVDARQPAAGLAQIGTRAFNDEGWAAIVTETAR